MEQTAKSKLMMDLLVLSGDFPETMSLINGSREQGAERLLYALGFVYCDALENGLLSKRIKKAIIATGDFLLEPGCWENRQKMHCLAGLLKDAAMSLMTQGQRDKLRAV